MSQPEESLPDNHSDQEKSSPSQELKPVSNVSATQLSSSSSVDWSDDDDNTAAWSGFGGFSGYSYKPRPEKDPKEMWAAEEKLTVDERRKRYHCGKRFVTSESIPTWQEYSKKIARKKSKETQHPDRKTDLTQSTGVYGGHSYMGGYQASRMRWSTPNWGDEEDEDEDDDPNIKVDYAALNKNAVTKPRKEINEKIALYHGDIVKLEIDAIVNAANEGCLGGGGIDGAIHSAAGDMLYEECRTLHGCPTGKTKITRGYDLPAKFVLHTVGPMHTDPVSLTSCYETIMELIEKYQLKTVAFCGVSTGIFGYPLYPASKIAIEVVRQWLEKDDNYKKVDKLIFCTFLAKEKVCYEELVPLWFPFVDDSAPQAANHNDNNNNENDNNENNNNENKNNENKNNENKNNENNNNENNNNENKNNNNNDKTDNNPSEEKKKTEKESNLEGSKN